MAVRAAQAGHICSAIKRVSSLKVQEHRLQIGMEACYDIAVLDAAYGEDRVDPKIAVRSDHPNCAVHQHLCGILDLRVVPAHILISAKFRYRDPVCLEIAVAAVDQSSNSSHYTHLPHASRRPICAGEIVAHPRDAVPQLTVFFARSDIRAVDQRHTCHHLPKAVSARSCFKKYAHMFIMLIMQILKYFFDFGILDLEFNLLNFFHSKGSFDFVFYFLVFWVLKFFLLLFKHSLRICKT